MIDTEEQARRRAAARERFTADNRELATRLRTALIPAAAAEAEYRDRYAEAAESLTDEERASGKNWGDVEQLVASRVDPAVRDRRAAALEETDKLAHELDLTVTHGIVAGAWHEGDELWTASTVHRAEPLRVAQVANADRPTAFERDAAGTVIAATYDLSTVVLTGDGRRITAEQHVPAWDDEHDRPLEDTAAPVPYEVWGGAGFQRSGTVHPTSRGWLDTGRLG